MTFYGRIRIREKGQDPTGSGSATLIVHIYTVFCLLVLNKIFCIGTFFTFLDTLLRTGSGCVGGESNLGCSIFSWAIPLLLDFLLCQPSPSRAALLRPQKSFHPLA